MRALALCELPAPVFAAAAFAVVGVAVRDILTARRPASLVLDGDGGWRLDAAGREPFAGRLVESGYRSAALLVIELERENAPVEPGRTSPRAGERTGDMTGHPTGERSCAARGRYGRGTARRRVTIFADSVDAADFSFLHLQLAFVATAAGPPR